MLRPQCSDILEIKALQNIKAASILLQQCYNFFNAHVMKNLLISKIDTESIKRLFGIIH